MRGTLQPQPAGQHGQLPSREGPHKNEQCWSVAAAALGLSSTEQAHVAIAAADMSVSDAVKAVGDKPDVLPINS